MSQSLEKSYDERMNLHISELERELELKNQYISHLESVLNEILPLRRHFKRQIKTKLKNTNRNIIELLKNNKKFEPVELAENNIDIEDILNVDKINFHKYNKSMKVTLTLRIYLRVVGFMTRFFAKFLRIGKI